MLLDNHNYVKPTPIIKCTSHTGSTRMLIFPGAGFVDADRLCWLGWAFGTEPWLYGGSEALRMEKLEALGRFYIDRLETEINR